MKLIAFYLPQFHPIPENDAWWGTGFTEWTNVARAKPLFPGHYQPHLPADLGFYDLRVPEIMAQQAAMASAYGVHGFCFYYYWFNGKRLLEKPVEALLARKDLDLPYCLCYANENWSRRWDGSEDELLISQTHGPEDDVAFIESLIPYFQDPRYIRVDGKPVLVVYRAALLPDIEATTARWRERCRQAGIHDLYLCKVESQGDFRNPLDIGFNASLEFPPHNVTSLGQQKGLVQNFSGLIFDYVDTLISFTRRPRPAHPLLRCVMPSWDNTARKETRSYVFVGSSPTAYHRWLSTTIQDTRRHNSPQEQLVFINAWNEWAEGAHLEPCKKYGKRFLEATLGALQENGYALDRPAANFVNDPAEVAAIDKRLARIDDVEPKLVTAIRTNALYRAMKNLIPLDLKLRIVRFLGGR
jgi:lipopolysaccharide biosynthesis protein